MKLTLLLIGMDIAIAILWTEEYFDMLGGISFDDIRLGALQVISLAAFMFVLRFEIYAIKNLRQSIKGEDDE